MVALLKFVDSLASADSEYLKHLLLANHILLQYASQELKARLIAFDKGLISCQQLLDVLVAPFVKLGHKALELQGTSQKGVLDGHTVCWFEPIAAALQGFPVQDSEGVGSFKIAVRPQKRLELVKALLKSQLLEVSWSITYTHKAEIQRILEML